MGSFLVRNTAHYVRKWVNYTTAEVKLLQVQLFQLKRKVCHHIQINIFSLPVVHKIAWYSPQPQNEHAYGCRQPLPGKFLSSEQNQACMLCTTFHVLFYVKPFLCFSFLSFLTSCCQWQQPCRRRTLSKGREATHMANQGQVQEIPEATWPSLANCFGKNCTDTDLELVRLAHREELLWHMLRACNTYTDN